MESTIQKLIQEVKEKAKTDAEKRVEYLLQLDELLEGCKGKHGKMGVMYFPNAYNGEKICFNMNGDESNIKQMMGALMSKGMVESFFNQLTKVELPFYLNGDIHSHKDWIIGSGRF